MNLLQKTFLLLFSILSLHHTSAQEAAVAFPGAEGFGRYATGGRGGAVYHVTTLDDGDEPGTFRYAVSQKGARTIVFDVAGTIFLHKNLNISNGDLTIAGQTAPGQGICIAHYPVTVSADNVIVRYLRFRPGNEGGGEPDGFGGRYHKNVIIDHCSISWSVDEACTFYGGENVTVQWCLISESLRTAGHSKNTHGYGAIVGGDKSSFHHNLMAHHESRVPRLGPSAGTQEREQVDMRNNVFYNWAGAGCYGGEGMKVNIVNNYYKPGPATPKEGNVRYRIAALGVRTTRYVTGCNGKPNVWKPMEHVWGRYYVEGNVVAGNDEVTRDNWTKGIYEQIDAHGNDGTFTEQVKREIRLTAPLETDLVTTHTADEAYRLVLQHAGCSKNRDIIDERIVEEVRNGTATYYGSVTPDAGTKPGLIDLPDDVRPAGAASAWPTLDDGGITPDRMKDSDGDGMPDWWEKANGLNPLERSDGNATTLSKTGYTNLEVYMNSLVADITQRQNEMKHVTTSMAQAPVPVKPRILISTDIGGTDPDDNQSMAHYLMYSNLFDTEGLVSSPSYGSGNVSEILRMIDLYEKDLPQLKKMADGFPAPDYLRSISKQGRAGAAPYRGFQTATEGSDWIVRCARKESDQPLWVLVWGGLDDVAQALHDAPDIQEKIRIYWIGGPNKKWSTNSYAYIVNHFPNLWFIENNASYRGFIANYKQMDQFNGLYHDTFIRGGGNLGKDFNNYLNGNTKMGDTPSLLYMMDGNPDDPTKESWGGSFVKCTHSPQILFDRPTTAQDTVQIYSIMEFRVKGPVIEIPADSVCMVMTINRQTWDGFYLGDGVYAVRHATYALGTMPYTIVSDIPGFPNQKGEITVENVWPGRQRESDFKLGDNWYTDRSDEALFHNNQHGFKTVSKWRIDAMSDWAERWSWLKKKKPRVIVTTDGEIDDQSSMVRFLMFASDYDVAGIVQVNGVQKDGHSKDRWIEAQIEQYAQVVPNLRLHDPDYPEAESLMNVLKVGNEVRGDMYKAPPLLSHSEGAQLIIDVLLDDDPRPVHILAWGGANTQANALWQIKANHSPEAWERAVSKARLYCIWYQDGGGKWIEENLPEIVIYESGAPFRDGGWRYVWDYMSVDHYYKNRPSKNPKELQAIMDKPWLTEQIKSGHGPLCAAYPQDYTSEGDSPSFMPLINNGLEQHLDYTLGGWGGRPEYRKGNHMQDGNDLYPSADTLSTHYTFQRWLPAAQNEWAARADWCVKPYHQANHPPVISLNSSANLTARPGDEIKMEISANDPDGDRLTYHWWQYVEAGSYRKRITLDNSDQPVAHLTLPADEESGSEIHLICEMTDCGSPRLTRYQRFIISVESDLRDNLK